MGFQSKRGSLQLTNLIERIDELGKENAQLEEQLADSYIETQRLDRLVIDLRLRIAELETRPTIASGVTWSREIDHTGEA